MSPARPRGFWLFKTEPSVFSYADLEAAPGRRTGWNGVRNYQVRNWLRDTVAVGDGVLLYHSSAEPTGIAGLARVSAAARPDPTQFDPRSPGYDPASTRAEPRWYEVEVEAVAALPQVLTLAELRAAPELATLAVLQHGQRLSILPVTPAEWLAILQRAGVREPRRKSGARP